jgi:hypothetical protein
MHRDLGGVETKLREHFLLDSLIAGEHIEPEKLEWCDEVAELGGRLDLAYAHGSGDQGCHRCGRHHRMPCCIASIEASLPEKAKGWQARSPLFEIALVFVRLDHVASGILNANHGIV